MSYSGATTSDLLQPSGSGRPAQLDALTLDTRLVTVTAGGNDVGYLPRLTLSSLPWPLRVLSPVRARIRKWGSREATDNRFAMRPAWRRSPAWC